jgi:hypothetical protein
MFLSDRLGRTPHLRHGLDKTARGYMLDDAERVKLRKRKKTHTRSEFGIEPVATTEGIVAIAPVLAQGFYLRNVGAVWKHR